MGAPVPERRSDKLIIPKTMIAGGWLSVVQSWLVTRRVKENHDTVQ